MVIDARGRPGEEGVLSVLDSAAGGVLADFWICSARSLARRRASRIERSSTGLVNTLSKNSNSRSAKCRMGSQGRDLSHLSAPADMNSF